MYKQGVPSDLGDDVHVVVFGAAHGCSVVEVLAHLVPQLRAELVAVFDDEVVELVQHLVVVDRCHV